MEKHNKAWVSFFVGLGLFILILAAALYYLPKRIDWFII